MVTLLKELIWPYFMYLLIAGTCVYALYKKPEPAILLYAVLLGFPQLWEPIHAMPLGSMALTLLIFSALVGGWVHVPTPQARGPNATLVIVLILFTYFCVLRVSSRYDLPPPISADNPVFTNWRTFSFMLLLYFVGYRVVRTEKHISTLAIGLAVMLLLLSFREFRNFYAGDGFSYNRRTGETFGLRGLNANHFAAFIAYICALLAGLFACDENKSRRKLYLGAFCFALYPLFFSYSRGAYGAVLLAVIMVALTRQRKLLIPLAILIVSWQAILPDSVVERITMTESADGDIEESAALRLVVWDLAKTLYAENPGLGIGFEGFWFASAHLPLRNAHNYFLQVAAEQGTVGLLLLATILIRAALSAAQLYRQTESPIMRGLGLGFAAMICAMVVANLFGDRFSMLEMGSYFWLLLGAVDRARQTASLPTPSPAATVVKSVA